MAGLKSGLKSKAAKLGNQAAGRLMKSEKVMTSVFKAVTKVQAGKKSLDKLGDSFLHALGFASRGDYKALGKRIGGLKKKLRETSSKLDSLR